MNRHRWADPYYRASVYCFLALVIVIVCAVLANCQTLDGPSDPTRLPPASPASGAQPTRPSSTFHALAWTYTGLAVADVTQSQIALHSGRFYEVNSFTYGSGQGIRMGLTKGLATGGVLWTAYALRSTHPKVALGLVTAFLGAQAVVVAHNAIVMEHAR